MDKSVVQLGENGSCPSLKPKLGRKHRLRIQGTAILERENHPNVTASYEYSTAYPNTFFEEDMNELHHFELNKIALGMTIYKKEDLPLKLTSNGHHLHSVSKNGLKNGDCSKELQVETYGGESMSEPLLTDVIWSRVHMANPKNPNAYVIKQYYNPGSTEEPVQRHGERCNSFLCGFITCCLIMAVACAFAFYSKRYYQT